MSRISVSVVQIAILLFFLISPFAARTEDYRIGVSPAIFQTFPDISFALQILDEQPGSPLKFVGEVDLLHSIASRFPKGLVVVAFSSEQPETMRDFVALDPARMIEATFLAASASPTPLSERDRHIIVYPDFTEFHAFAQDVLGSCLFTANGQPSRSAYQPIRDEGSLPEHFHGLILKTLMNHSYVFADRLMYYALVEQRMRPIAFSNEEHRNQFLKCLDANETYRFNEVHPSSLDSMSDLLESMMETAGADLGPLRGISKSDEIAFFGHRDVMAGFSAAFRGFLHATFVELVDRNFPTIEPFSRAYELLSDNADGTLAVATQVSFRPAMAYWRRLPRRTILNRLSRRKPLGNDYRPLVELATDHLQRFFKKIDGLPREEITLTVLEAMRLSAYLDYFLHHDALNRDRARESEEFLVRAHSTIDELFLLLDYVVSRSGGDFDDLLRNDEFEELNEYWRPQLEKLRSIPTARGGRG